MKYGLVALISAIYLLAKTKATIKAPGWKHCMHNLHALPNKWGSIVSPGFPNGINTQIQCSWVIQANPGYKVKLAFHTLNVTGSRRSCYTQFVEILDYKAGNSMGKFCGTSRPGDYVSYGYKVRFDLQGDTSGEKTKGFDLRYKATREPGGFKSTWSFSGKPSAPKNKKKPARPRGRQPPGFSGPKQRKPSGPAKSAGNIKPGSSKPNKALPDKIPDSSNNEGGKDRSASVNPVSRKPQRSQAPRIEFRRPTSRQNNNQVIYGSNTNARGVDHGQSSVITMSDQDEEGLDVTMIAIIAAGGAVLLTIIIVIIKLCVCDKNKKKRKRKKARERRMSINRNAVPEEAINMVPVTGMVPEQYMGEEIMPHPSSYHRMHSLPAMPSTMSQIHYPMAYGHSMRRKKSRTAATMPPTGTRSSRSRTRSYSRSRAASSSRSRVSRKDNIRDKKPERRERAQSSAGHPRSRSLSYLPSQMDGWVRVENLLSTSKSVRKHRHPTDSDFESSDDMSDSSSDFDSDSSSEYRRPKSQARKKRHSSLPRNKSHNPPPHGGSLPMPYYIVDKAREFDEGYDTSRRTTGTKATASKGKRNNKTRGRDRGRKSRRKYSD